MNILIITFVCMAGLLQPCCSQVDEIDDLLNITKFNPVFPQDYNYPIRAGYLNITPYNQALYYLLAESQNIADKDPLILWLGGGPGCSSITDFFNGNGPFIFPPGNAQQMINNVYSWNKQANLLYLDCPAGTGLSTATPKYLLTNETTIAKQNLRAMQLFFDRYSKFRGNDFYIAGDAGLHITRLAQLIINSNQGIQQTRINIRGILIQNGQTLKEQYYSNTYFSRFTTEYLYTRGFIEQSQMNQYRSTCLTNQASSSCKALQQTIYKYINGTNANLFNIYGKCSKLQYPGFEGMFKTYRERIRAYNALPTGIKKPWKCMDISGTIILLNSNQYRDALKIGSQNSTVFWIPCSNTVNYTVDPLDDQPYKILHQLTQTGLKVMYFSGDFDAVTPITGTIYWFDKYKLDYQSAIKKSWRPWVAQSQNISGMVWQYNTITLATVRGAGHMVSWDKPAEALELFNVFLERNGWKYPDYYLQAIQ